MMQCGHDVRNRNQHGGCDACGAALPPNSEDPASGILLCPDGCKTNTTLTDREELLVEVKQGLKKLNLVITAVENCLEFELVQRLSETHQILRWTQEYLEGKPETEPVTITMKRGHRLEYDQDNKNFGRPTGIAADDHFTVQVSQAGQNLDAAKAQQYLDEAIHFWRAARRGEIDPERQELTAVAQYYIDAFQSVRTSLLGSTLPEESHEPQT